MGNFSNNAITGNGRSLLADVHAGAVFIPTKIVLGSGNLPAGKTSATMTDVVTPVIELEINKIEKTNDGKCIIGGVYSNQEITADFYFRELAIYARAEYRDEGGTVTKAVPEVLYSYGNAGTTADLMTAYSTSSVVEKQIDLVIYVGQNAAVSLTVESGVFLTRDQAQTMIDDSLSRIDLAITDISTGAKYRWGIDNGAVYLEEVTA